MSEFPSEPVEQWSLDDLGRAARVCPNPLRRQAVDELLRRADADPDEGRDRPDPPDGGYAAWLERICYTNVDLRNESVVRYMKEIARRLREQDREGRE